MRSVDSSGTRVQYTHPPNGSLNGTPSRSTSVRLTPLGPIPRSETPCDVGFDEMLLDRVNKLNVGSCRSTSSTATAGDCLMSADRSTLTLADTSARRCSVRAAVTVMSSRSDEGSSVTVMALAFGSTVCCFSAKPGALTTSVTVPEPGASTLNCPSVPDTAARSPSDVRATMEAPGTTAPEVSLTTPERLLPARAANRERTAMIMGRNYTAGRTAAPARCARCFRGWRVRYAGLDLLLGPAAGHELCHAQFERVSQHNLLLVDRNGVEVRDDGGTIDADVVNPHLRREHLNRPTRGHRHRLDDVIRHGFLQSTEGRRTAAYRSSPQARYQSSDAQGLADLCVGVRCLHRPRLQLWRGDLQRGWESTS